MGQAQLPGRGPWTTDALGDRMSKPTAVGSLGSSSVRGEAESEERGTWGELASSVCAMYCPQHFVFTSSWCFLSRAYYHLRVSTIPCQSPHEGENSVYLVVSPVSSLAHTVNI